MKRVIEIDEELFHEIFEARDRDCPLTTEGTIIANSTLLADEEEIMLALHNLRKHMVEMDKRFYKLQGIIEQHIGGYIV